MQETNAEDDMLRYSHPIVVALSLKGMTPQNRVATWDFLKLRSSNAFTSSLVGEFSGVTFPALIDAAGDESLVRCYFSEDQRDIAALLKLTHG